MTFMVVGWFPDNKSDPREMCMKVIPVMTNDTSSTFCDSTSSYYGVDGHSSHSSLFKDSAYTGYD